MSTFIIPSVFKAIDQVTGPIRRIQRQVDSLYGKLNIFNKIGSAASFLGLSVGVAGVTSLMGKLVTETMKVEDATASFTALLGSADKAAKLVADLNKLGAATPFQFDDLAKATKLMMGFGAATEKDIIGKLRMLGDLSMGNAEKLGGITLAFSQIQAAGKASMQDINQLINNNVPVLGQLAKQWGVNIAQARKFVEQGKATGTEISKAFAAMTSKGGMFYRSMEIASGTLSGKWSTLTDSINLAFATIGMQALPIIKEFADEAIRVAGRIVDWANANKDLIKIKVKEWFTAIGNGIRWVSEHLSTIIDLTKWYLGLLLSLRAISLLAAFAQGVLAVGLFIFSKEARAAKMAQIGLNAAMLASPITWVTLAIGLLVAAIIWLKNHVEGWGKTWQSVLTWVRATTDTFVLSNKLGFLRLANAFQNMVDSMVTAWAWGKNAIGLMSDQQFAALKSQIQAEKALRISGMYETAAALKQANIIASAGPQSYLQYKKMDSSSSILNGLVGALKQKSDSSSAEITIKDKTGKAEVTKKSPGASINMTSTMAQFGN